MKQSYVTVGAAEGKIEGVSTYFVLHVCVVRILKPSDAKLMLRNIPSRRNEARQQQPYLSVVFAVVTENAGDYHKTVVGG